MFYNFENDWDAAQSFPILTNFLAKAQSAKTKCKVDSKTSNQEKKKGKIGNKISMNRDFGIREKEKSLITRVCVSPGISPKGMPKGFHYKKAMWCV